MERPDDLVLFSTFDDAVHAHIIKGVLETNGIDAVVNNELTSSVFALQGIRFTQVRLMVRRCDLELAHKIILENEQNTTLDSNEKSNE